MSNAPPPTLPDGPPPAHVLTPDPAAHAYPRPQLVRAEWTSLNGTWEFALDRAAAFGRADEVVWDRTIVVPFAPETAASGVDDPGFYRRCWYRRTFDAPALAAGERLLLHFGAVDYEAAVWVNGVQVTRHEGGYTPFSADITDALRADGPQHVVVCADDDAQDLAKPRGKQDWLLHPHSIWYPRTTGIWQTVWLERVPATRMAGFRWSSSLERWEVGIAARIEGPRAADGLRVAVRLTARGETLADDTYLVTAGEIHRRIALSDPGIDDYRNALLWRPEHPTLIDAELTLLAPDGTVLDRATSYCALRQAGVQGDRFMLNGRPYHLRLALDQGYWGATGLTAPTDDALRHDVELAKAMGFNGVRKHQKIEDPRYLYWADRLGLLVWEEMPSTYRFTRRSVERLTKQWFDVITRDASHPCIVAWVPFNESWGVPDLPTTPAQRHWVSALYHLTRTMDHSRPVVGNDGWESVATDIIGIHDYDADPERLRRRYRSDVELPQIFERERPGGRLLVLEGVNGAAKLPVVLSEFGGIALSHDEARTWGYSRSRSMEEFERRYTALLAVVNGIGLFAGFCYTQFADTYQEANGLVTMDRVPKFALAEIRRATTGAPAAAAVAATAPDAGVAPGP
ncbi:beta-galactosidase [Gemmatimonadetes bacterium T265]|nr:beta-galactosidase [Gemmatimonadetes bacterium T265]